MGDYKRLNKLDIMLFVGFVIFVTSYICYNYNY